MPDGASMQPPLAYTVCTPECSRVNPLAYAAPFDEALEELAGLGYAGVEIQVRDPGELDTRDIVAQLDANGLTAAALATGHVGSEDGLRLHGSADLRRRAVERLVTVIDLAAELDTLVTIGSVRGTPGAPEEVAATRRALDELAHHAAGVGVRLVLEPQNRFVGPYLRTVAETLALIEDAGWDNVGIVADTFHLQLDERSLAGALIRAADRLWHVQLGESHRGPLGAGSLPLVGVLDALDALGYRGWLVMEHDQDGDSRTAAGRSRGAVELARPGPSDDASPR